MGRGYSDVGAWLLPTTGSGLDLGAWLPTLGRGLSWIWGRGSSLLLDLAYPKLGAWLPAPGRGLSWVWGRGFSQALPPFLCWRPEPPITVQWTALVVLHHSGQPHPSAPGPTRDSSKRSSLPKLLPLAWPLLQPPGPETPPASCLLLLPLHHGLPHCTCFWPLHLGGGPGTHSRATAVPQPPANWDLHTFALCCLSTSLEEWDK